MKHCLRRRKIQLKKVQLVAVHMCNPSTWEGEAKGERKDKGGNVQVTELAKSLLHKLEDLSSDPLASLKSLTWCHGPVTTALRGSWGHAGQLI